MYERGQEGAWVAAMGLLVDVQVQKEQSVGATGQVVCGLAGAVQEQGLGAKEQGVERLQEAWLQA